VKEKDFFVLMVSKVRRIVQKSTRFNYIVAQPKAPAPAAAASSSTPAPAAAVPVTPAAAAPAPEAPAPAAATPAAAPAPTTPAAPAAAAAEPPAPAVDTPFGASFLSGSALETAVANLVEMGFPRDEVQRAMRASFNNPDRAAEYLMTVRPISYSFSNSFH
jgi:UV excision repair protein RAD23